MMPSGWQLFFCSVMTGVVHEHRTAAPQLCRMPGAKRRACNFRRRDAQAAVFLVQGQQAVPDHSQGVTLVVGIEAVRHSLLLVQQRQLGGGAAGIDADVDAERISYALWKSGSADRVDSRRL